LRELLWTLNPVRLWEALQEAEEGVCVMCRSRSSNGPAIAELRRRQIGAPLNFAWLN
jgi:hypothetical protein